MFLPVFKPELLQTRTRQGRSGKPRPSLLAVPRQATRLLTCHKPARIFPRRKSPHRRISNRRSPLRQHFVSGKSLASMPEITQKPLLGAGSALYQRHNQDCIRVRKNSNASYIGGYPGRGKIGFIDNPLLPYENLMGLLVPSSQAPSGTASIVSSSNSFSRIH